MMKEKKSVLNLCKSACPVRKNDCIGVAKKVEKSASISVKIIMEKK